MKADKFDEAIRKKLDSLVPSQSEADIERVHQFVRHNRPPTFWGKYGSLLSYSAVAGVVASLIVVILTQRYENKNLQKQLANFQQPKSLPLDTLHTLPMQVSKQHQEDILTHPETLQNGNSVEQEEVINLKNPNQKTTLAPNIPSKKVERSLSIQPQTSLSNTVTKPQVIDNETDKRENNSVQTSKTYASVTNKGVIVAEGKSYRNRFQKKQRLLQKTTEELDFEQAIDNTTTSQANELIKESIDSRQGALQSLNGKMFTFSDMGKLNPKTPAQVVALTNEGTQVGGWTLSFKNITYRVGLGADAGSGLGYGLVADAFLTERLSINTGIRLFSAHGDDFDTDYSFRVRKSQDFRAIYAPRLMPTQEIRNIKEENYIVQIPVNLAYHLPLQNNFSLITSLGTDLDIAAMKYVRFDFRDFNGQPRPDTKDSLQTVSVFNNLTASVGVQKQVNRFVFQAAPYVSKQLKEVPYKQGDWQWGIRLRVLYDFGRN